ncbi:hypothetical protein CC1G_09414 [Coprinopsis cinerea okayama7|uniref:Uncharacterized protein n=1 Tax=Coprinopsis cinerea (strain Okayama-7 / 130 / ATCC MYA-4618 / FGSC 9003) TaxID=240176 RepID=A8NII1_COPC7|nr:hypothetical protein CC1G_09414 [Coprinopsis cinerea okayama7\|eukprot:XP_001834000.1 hypothetical protein CC1G_09414 [Coprinopsis cinerea okayama7\
MAPTTLGVAPGEPKESPKPQPIGNQPLIFLITTCTLCGLFLLWRKAEAVRRVVSHRLKTFRRPEGQIRLSEDDGPSATLFLGDDFDDDNAHIDASDTDTLSEQMRRATQAWREPNILHLIESEPNTPIPAQLQPQAREPAELQPLSTTSPAPAPTSTANPTPIPSNMASTAPPS